MGPRFLEIPSGYAECVPANQQLIPDEIGRMHYGKPAVDLVHVVLSPFYFMSSTPATHGEHMVRILLGLPFSLRPSDPIIPDDPLTQPPIDITSVFPVVQVEDPPPPGAQYYYRNELHRIIVSKFLTTDNFEKICDDLKSILIVADNGLDQAPSSLSVTFIMGRIFKAFRVDFMHVVSYAAGYYTIVYSV